MSPGAAKAIALALPLAACATPPPAALGPDAIPVLPQRYAALPTAERGRTTLAGWWRQFDDPVLTRLVEQAVTANQDVAQAAARLVQARARSGGAAAARLPSLSATLDPSRAVAGPMIEGAPGTSLSGSVALGWDPDLFGALRGNARAARADLAAAGYDLAALRNAAAAEVTASYIAFRAAGGRERAARAALTGQRQLLDVIQHRYEIGIAVAADVERARLQLLQVEALIPTLDDARRRAASRIAVLIGAAPGTIEPLLTGGTDIPRAAQLPAAGIPLDLLRRRAEIRAAEARLTAAAARIGVARAALRPQFSLGAVIGGSALSLPGLAESLVTTIVGQISQVLFDGGRGRAAVDEQRGAAREALAAYRATILAAIEDVENARSGVASSAERVRIGAAAAAAARRTAGLTRGAYDLGLADLFVLLDAEQQALGQQDTLILARADLATVQARLFVALGGDWGKDEILTLDRPPAIP